jgi:phage antirepressor YoqD-like protein
MPYAQHTPSLFEVKEFTKGGYANVQTMITPKGREVFKLLYSQTIA